MLKFSHSGLLLACACADAIMFPIRVFELATGACVVTFTGFEEDSVSLLSAFPGHHDLIYDLCWSQNDGEILTASSDGTAKVWTLPTKEQLQPQPEAQLQGSTIALSTVPNIVRSDCITVQHTTFVYCAKYHPSNPKYDPSLANLNLAGL